MQELAMALSKNEVGSCEKLREGPNSQNERIEGGSGMKFDWESQWESRIRSALFRKLFWTLSQEQWEVIKGFKQGNNKIRFSFYKDYVSCSVQM